MVLTLQGASQSPGIIGHPQHYVLQQGHGEGSCWIVSSEEQGALFVRDMDPIMEEYSSSVVTFQCGH